MSKRIPKLTNSSVSNIIIGLTMLIEYVFTSLKVVLKIFDIPFLQKKDNLDVIFFLKNF